MKPHIYKTTDGGTTWKEIVNGLPDDPINVVREDPYRKGLLYAGSERAVYVSFDDGAHWQSLRLNMPATSIRDLVIKEDDIVVYRNRSNETIVHRLIQKQSGGWIVAGDNNARIDNEYVTSSNYLGKVIQILNSD